MFACILFLVCNGVRTEMKAEQNENKMLMNRPQFQRNDQSDYVHYAWTCCALCVSVDHAYLYTLHTCVLAFAWTTLVMLQWTTG